MNIPYMMQKTSKKRGFQKLFTNGRKPKNLLKNMKNLNYISVYRNGNAELFPSLPETRDKKWSLKQIESYGLIVLIK